MWCFSAECTNSFINYKFSSYRWLMGGLSFKQKGAEPTTRAWPGWVSNCACFQSGSFKCDCWLLGDRITGCTWLAGFMWGHDCRLHPSELTGRLLRTTAVQAHFISSHLASISLLTVSLWLASPGFFVVCRRCCTTFRPRMLPECFKRREKP